METKIDLEVKIIFDRDGEVVQLKDVLTKSGISILSELGDYEKSDAIEAVKELSDKNVSVNDVIDNVELRDVEVSVEGTYTRGTPDYFSSSFGNWLPGDPPDSEIKSVMIGRKNITKDITDYQMDKITDEFMELMSDETDEPDYDIDESIQKYNEKLDKIADKLDSKLRRGKVKSKLVDKDSKIPGFSYYFQKK